MQIFNQWSNMFFQIIKALKNFSKTKFEILWNYWKIRNISLILKKLFNKKLLSKDIFKITKVLL